MKQTVKITSILLLSFLMVFTARIFAQSKKDPIRVLLFTGGHDFDRNAFDVFKNSLPGITVTEVAHPNALAMLRPDKRSSFDVIMLYDMPNAITEQEKQDFMDCLKSGKGLVVLHHAFASYPNWPEFQQIMGGRYHLNAGNDSRGVAYPASTYQHDVRFRVKVAGKKHPVTKGVGDFDILDEMYDLYSVNPEVRVLLTTEASSGIIAIAWTHRYGKSKIVTNLMGHDNHAWTNPEFVKLLVQTIKWVK